MPAMTLRASAASWTGASSNRPEKPAASSAPSAAVSERVSLTLSITASSGRSGARPARSIAASAMHEAENVPSCWAIGSGGARGGAGRGLVQAGGEDRAVLRGNGSGRREARLLEHRVLVLEVAVLDVDE